MQIFGSAAHNRDATSATLFWETSTLFWETSRLDAPGGNNSISALFM
jgi:hypothetical protein